MPFAANKVQWNCLHFLPFLVQKYEDHCPENQIWNFQNVQKWQFLDFLKKSTAPLESDVYVENYPTIDFPQFWNVEEL